MEIEFIKFIKKYLKATKGIKTKKKTVIKLTPNFVCPTCKSKVVRYKHIKLPYLKHEAT